MLYVIYEAFSLDDNLNFEESKGTYRAQKNTAVVPAVFFAKRL